MSKVSILMTVLLMAIGAAMWGLWSSYFEPKLLLFSPERRVGNFANMDKVFPASHVPASTAPLQFEKQLKQIVDNYQYDYRIHSVRDFIERSSSTGLLVIKDGKIVHEWYIDGYDASTTITSFSVAKSFVSTLIGIAHDEGLLSVDDPIIKHIPQLKDSGFADATIEDALQMSTGIAFSEIYEDKSTDSYTIFDKMFIWAQPIDLLTGSYDSKSSPGQQFNYASINTQVLSYVLRSVYNKPLVDILHEKIWQPAGMSSSAYWNTDLYGKELGFMALNATLRDYAKLGLLMLNNGTLNGHRIVSSAWVETATSPAKPYLERGKIYGEWGYQHQWWLPKGNNQDFAAIGIWGQMIYVNPAKNVVIVKSAADPKFKDHEFESVVLFRQIANTLK